MHLTPDQRLARLGVRVAELDLWLERRSLDLLEHGGWTFDGAPLARGAPWPERAGEHRIALAELRVPDDWDLDATRIDLDLGGEGLVTLRYPDGPAPESFGLNPHHERFPLLARRASLEALCVARLEFGVPHPDPRLARARLVERERELEPYARTLRLLHEFAGALGGHELIDPLLLAAERSLRRLRWPSRTGPYVARTVDRLGTLPIWQPPDPRPAPEPLDDDARASVAEAAAALETDLADLRARWPKVGRVALSGHAHLDLAWLWPEEESRRKARRTLHGMRALLRRDPAFTFNQSSAQLYAWLEEDDPELFAGIRADAAEGRLEPVGGMWVEPDLNMPTGESLARQLLYGQRAFERWFGEPHRVAWLPDCFGFTPALPQLLRQAGIDAFFTHKLLWNETSRFPFDLFRWRGLDGSEVLAHMFENGPFDEGYNGRVRPTTLLRVWRNYRSKERHPETLLSVGWGDGGGGPTPEMLANARAMEALPLLPDARWSRVDAFFDRAARSADAADAEDEPLPVWAGELYLELHRGTLTTQGRAKRLHRRAEQALMGAETLASLAHLWGGPAPDSLEPLWRRLLFTQFHDILPGSSIREVSAATEAQLAKLIDDADAVAQGALDAAAERLVEPGAGDALLLVNDADTARRPQLELPDPAPGSQRSADGRHLLALAAPLPALAAAVRPLGGGESDSDADPAFAPATASRAHLANGVLRVDLDERGRLARVRHLPSGREVLDGVGNRLWAYVDRPRAWDAWDVDAGYRDQGEEIAGVEAIEVVETGPHRAAVRVTRRFRHSRIVQEYRLWRGSARLDVATRLDWRDRRWLLKARFPLAVASHEAVFEGAFGLVRRPTHRNTPADAARFEVAGHRFAYLLEPGFGAALLNDGRYGHHALGSELGLSLLRSPVYPDYLADEGEHEFTYSLWAGEEAGFVAALRAEADALHRPVRARRVRAAGALERRGIDLDLGAHPLGLGALKRAEDGDGLVLRVYEPQGARGAARVALPGDWQRVERVDLLERPLDEPDAPLRPFEVRSYRLRRDG